MGHWRKSVRSIAAKGIVFLLLGATLNVAVAWWCGWRSEIQVDRTIWGSTNYSRTPVEGLPVNMWLVPGLGIQRLHVYKCRCETHPSTGFRPLEDVWPGWIALDEVQLTYTGNEYFMGDVLAQGWPELSLYCDYPDIYSRQVSGGIWLSQNMAPNTFLMTDHVLALRPIWRGFATNTMFYAWMLWLLATGFSWLRRGRRIRRGLCPACAYPVGASAACSECGGAVRVRSAEARMS